MRRYSTKRYSKRRFGFGPWGRDPPIVGVSNKRSRINSPKKSPKKSPDKFHNKKNT